VYLLAKIVTSFVALLFAVICVMTTNKSVTASMRRRYVSGFTAIGAGALVLAASDILSISPRSALGVSLLIIGILLGLHGMGRLLLRAREEKDS
jgi:hypothetical protein